MFSFLSFFFFLSYFYSLQLDLEGDEENVEPSISGRWGRVTLLSYRKHGLVGKKLELSTVGSGDLRACLAVPGSKTLHTFHKAHAFLHLSKAHVCQTASHSGLAGQMKNWELFVFALDKVAEPECFRVKFSSSNFSLSMDRLPVPLWGVVEYEVATLPPESWNNSSEGGTHIQILSLQCSDHQSFLLPLELCQRIA